ncbi:MAG: putative ABC transporter permease [Faecalibacterium sp.]
MTLELLHAGRAVSGLFFLGWVGETVVATFRGSRFTNRGMASGPFCFVYGTTAILMAVGFADMRTKPVVLFVACMLTLPWWSGLRPKLLERLHNRKWWDYSDKALQPERLRLPAVLAARGVRWAWRPSCGATVCSSGFAAMLPPVAVRAVAVGLAWHLGADRTSSARSGGEPLRAAAPARWSS